jgi:hypothetical protein
MDMHSNVRPILVGIAKISSIYHVGDIGTAAIHGTPSGKNYQHASKMTNIALASCTPINRDFHFGIPGSLDCTPQSLI